MKNQMKDWVNERQQMSLGDLIKLVVSLPPHDLPRGANEDVVLIAKARLQVRQNIEKATRPANPEIGTRAGDGLLEFSPEQRAEIDRCVASTQPVPIFEIVMKLLDTDAEALASASKQSGQRKPKK